MTLMQDVDIKHLLETAKTVAVVGYSDKPDRPSNDVARALKAAGYEIYPVNPMLQSDNGQKVYASLAEIPVPIDVVDIFRRPEDVPPVVEDAIATGAKAVWMQLGISNDAAAERAEEAGLQVVMNRCMKVENRRLLGR
ncbi:MAG: CoA-binding protein [Chloroflexota bacterium]